MLPSFDLRSNIPKFSHRFYKGPVNVTKLCDDNTLTFISNLKQRKKYVEKGTVYYLVRGFSSIKSCYRIFHLLFLWKNNFLASVSRYQKEE